MTIDASTRERRDEVVSPELALVDPATAELARAQLTDPDDTLARFEELVLRSRRSSLADLAMDEPARRPALPVGLGAHARGSRLRAAHARVALVAAGCAVLAVGVLLGVRVDLRGTSAGAESSQPGSTATEVERPTIPEPASPAGPNVGSKAPRQPPRAGGPVPPPPVDLQRFAWAPSPGVSGYRVELFRGPDKVFSAGSTAAAITIPKSWTFDGRRQRLEPGEYRWYVWPVVSGRRSGDAIVQAKLVVPPR